MNENNSKELWQGVVRTGAPSNNGCSANGLQDCAAAIHPMHISEAVRSNVNKSIRSTIKTTYQEDYGPREQRDQTKKVPQQLESKKWNRKIGFSANNLPNYEALVKAIHKTVTGANENIQSTYQHDFGPIEHRDQRNRDSKKQNTRNGLCKCDKNRYKADDPKVFSHQISQVKCAKNQSINNGERAQSQAQNSHVKIGETQKKNLVCSVYQSDYRDFSKVYNYLAYNATS